MGFYPVRFLKKYQNSDIFILKEGRILFMDTRLLLSNFSFEIENEEKIFESHTYKIEKLFTPGTSRIWAPKLKSYLSKYEFVKKSLFHNKMCR